jgi:hypothetical protein
MADPEHVMDKQEAKSGTDADELLGYNGSKYMAGRVEGADGISIHTTDRFGNTSRYLPPAELNRQ